MIYDVTLVLSHRMPVFPGEPAPQVIPIKRMAEGGKSNVSELRMSAHAGTHVDAPWHVLGDGDTIEKLDLQKLCGPARVIEISDREAIRASEVAHHDLTRVTRVLFKTRNSELLDQPDFNKDFVYIEADAAEWLVGRGMELVGSDYLSIEKFKRSPATAHRALLEAEVVVIEGLDLREVPAGDYELVCLPLRFAAAEAAPARVILKTL